MTDATDRPALAPPGTAIPRLPSTDLDRSRDFYEAIGFRERARYDDYLILVRGTIELHVTEGAFDPYTQAASVFVRVSDAEGLFHLAAAAFPDIVRCGAGALSAAEASAVRTQVEATGSHARIHELQAVDWGGRQFALIDPDGNLLHIGEAGALVPGAR